MNQKYSVPTAVGIAAGTIKGILITCNIYLLQAIVDTAVTGKYWDAMIRLCYMAVSTGIVLLADLVKSKMILVLNKRIEIGEGECLLNKISRLPYELFEDSALFPKFDRVMTDGVEQKKGLYQSIFNGVEFAVEYIGISIYACSVKWWCLLVIFLLTIPVWLLTIVGASSEGKFTQDNWKWNQKALIFSHILNSREFIKEEKIFGFYPLISKRWKENAEKYQHGKIRSSFSVRVWIGAVNFLQYAVTIVLAWLLILDIRKGSVTIGELVATMDSLWRMIGSALFTVVGLLGGFVGYSEYAKQRKWFMNLKEEKESGEELEDIRSVEFQNVCYGYPAEKEEDRRMVLQGVSFRIDQGERTALVGENGCGKSTVIKLMTGLLKPVSGTILINGRNAEDYSISSRRRAFSCVFQDYMTYDISLKDNIQLGALWQKEDPSEALSRIDRDLAANVGGMDQILGRSVEGARDVSGGQWQKIALARGIYSKASFWVLDEPTAAIDPISERDVIETMLKVRENCTKVFVTHRLGSVRFMDKVIVLRNGKVENIGTHETLRKEDPYYEKLYSTQEKWYRS